MKKSKYFNLFLVLILGLAFGPVTAADWPQWRGPERDGKSPEKGLLTKWPEGGPKLIWQSTGMGVGYSSLSIHEGRLFTMGDLAEGQSVVAADLNGGKVLWSTKIGTPWKDRYGGARSTPTTDGDRIYAISTEGDLFCLNASSGEVVWKRSLTKEFNGKMAAGQNVDWRFSESPLIDGDWVIVSPGMNDAALVALDKKTGKEIWRSKIPNLGERGADGAAYSSVVISNGGGTKQYVQLLGRGVVGVEAKTGRYLWGYNRVANDVANIATPIIHGDYVFTSTGYNTGSALLKLSKDGGGVKAEEVYFLPGNELQNHHGGMILKDGYIYTGTAHNKGFPISVNMKTGEKAWGPVRNEGKGSAAVSYADGHLYFRYQNGLMVLIEATPEEYREKGSFMIPNINQFSWSHPVIADGKLYLREQDNLYCYDISG